MRAVSVLGGYAVAAMVMDLFWSIGPPLLSLGHALASDQSSPPERSLLPSRCEQKLDGLYETRGPTTIQKLGQRYMLTVCCEGVHQIYVRVPQALDLEPFVGKPVRARYRYVAEENPRTRCVRAPCPPATERAVDITVLEEVTGAVPGADLLCK